MIRVLMGKYQRSQLLFLDIPQKLLPNRLRRVRVKPAGLPCKHVEADGRAALFFYIKNLYYYARISRVPGCHFRSHHSFRRIFNS